MPFTQAQTVVAFSRISFEMAEFFQKSTRAGLRIYHVKFLYNILFILFLVLTSPYYFFRMQRRGGWVSGFGMRFGYYDNRLKQAITNRQVFWLHAVSVGEVNICSHLIRALETRLPNVKMIVSTTTTTGMAELQAKLPSHISKIYYPIDRRAYVARALGTMHPEAVILVEAEIWPNFIWRAKKQGRPLFLVNARLSERSYRGYKRFAFLFRPLFASFTGVGAQSEEDAQRLRDLGCRPEAVHVVGGMKFDAAQINEQLRINVPAMMRQLGVPPEARVLVAGSTHPGEEAILADTYLRLKCQFPDLFLILVPRHFERGREVGRELETRGMKFAYRSEVNGMTAYGNGELQCLLVNTTGELTYFYDRADVVFVGKSLAAEGGQNPIEPGARSKAMIFGPNMQNFAETAKSFVSRDAAVQVPDATGLEPAIAQLLGDEIRRKEMGERARDVVRENLGAIERSVEMILKGIDHADFYVAPKK